MNDPESYLADANSCMGNFWICANDDPEKAMWATAALANANIAAALIELRNNR